VGLASQAYLVTHKGSGFRNTEPGLDAGVFRTRLRFLVISLTGTVNGLLRLFKSICNEFERANRQDQTDGCDDWSITSFNEQHIKRHQLSIMGTLIVSNS
jgi:hypothetical protein